MHHLHGSKPHVKGCEIVSLGKKIKIHSMLMQYSMKQRYDKTMALLVFHIGIMIALGAIICKVSPKGSRVPRSLLKI
jgi:hypothetical protein